MMHRYSAQLFSKRDDTLIAWLDFCAESDHEARGIAFDWANREGGDGYYSTLDRLDDGECLASWSW